MPVIVPLFTSRPPFSSIDVPADRLIAPPELIVVRLPPPSTRFDPLLLTAPPPLIVTMPPLTKSLAVTVPATVNWPALVFVPLDQVERLTGGVIELAVVGEVGDGGRPFWLTVTLEAVVTPVSDEPPVTAYVPGPRRKPPPTVAPFKVSVAPPATERVLLKW